MTYQFGCPFGRLRALSEVEGRLCCAKGSLGSAVEVPRLHPKKYGLPQGRASSVGSD